MAPVRPRYPEQRVGAGEPVPRACNDDPPMETGADGWSSGFKKRGSREAPVIDKNQGRYSHAKIGEPAVANSFLERNVTQR